MADYTVWYNTGQYEGRNGWNDSMMVAAIWCRSLASRGASFRNCNKRGGAEGRRGGEWARKQTKETSALSASPRLRACSLLKACYRVGVSLMLRYSTAV